MNKRVITIQDIAETLGMSRNTVSKALNGHYIPHKTKSIIVNKAIEMGYKGYNELSVEKSEEQNLKILLLTNKPLSNLNFFLSIIKGIESSIQNYNIDFFQYTLNHNNTNTSQFENYINSLNIDGIICIEMFDKNLIKNVLSFNIPTVLIDSLPFMSHYDGNYDILIMENYQSVYTITSKLIKNGFNKIGFVGDYRHCKGFYERYTGLKEALYNNKIEFNPQFCITESDEMPYGDSSWIVEKLKQLPQLPDVFICANDSIAISLMTGLQNMGKKVPEDVQIVGFDNIPESEFSTPSLSTINTNKEQLGQEVIHTLIERIKRSTIPNRTIYLRTNIVLRGSTRV